MLSGNETEIEELNQDELDEYVMAFEEAYSRAGSADPADFLPPARHPLHRAVLRELVRVDLELGWERGRPKALAAYLTAFPALADDREGLEAITYEEARLRRQAAGSSVRASRRTARATTRSALDSWCDSYEGRGGPARPEREDDDRRARGRARLPAVGDEFLGFRLIGELGRGTFGRVFLARQGDLADRPVVLKVSTATARCDESRMLARLQHTNIVPVYSRHQSDPFQAVCMPYYGATTLRDVFDDLKLQATMPSSGQDLLSSLGGHKGGDRSGTKPRLSPTESAGDAAKDGAGSAAARSAGPLPLPLPLPLGPLPDTLRKLGALSYVEAVLWMGSRLADGLAHAHDRGIVHRDLKPANILLTDDGQPMLLDFNLAVDTRRGGLAAAEVGGTLPYMAPEQLEALAAAPGAGRPVDARSDLYSLGVMLFELLTGRHPFPAASGPDVTALIADRRQRPPRVRPWNLSVTPAVEAIVRRCLEPDPERRYRSAGDLREDLERQLAHLPLRHTREPSPAERAGKWLRRHPRLTSLTSLGTIAVLLFLGLASALFFSERERKRSRATATLQEFHDRSDDARYVLNSPDGDRSLRARGQVHAARALALYAVEDDPLWRAQPRVALLPPDARARLEADVGEVLLLAARAAGFDAADTPAGPGRIVKLESALRLTEQAESCYAPDAVPAAVWRQRAVLADQIGRPDDGRRWARRARAAGMRTASDHYLTGSGLLAAGNYVGAQRAFDEVKQVEPGHYWAWFGAGRCAEDFGSDDQAVACYSTCAALRPEHAAAWLNRGLVFYRQKKHDQAIADFTHAITLRPDHPDPYINRAVARIDRRKSADARAAGRFEQALLFRSDRLALALNRAVVLLEGRRQYQEALADLDQAQAQGADRSRLGFMKARVYKLLGDTRAAESARAEGLRSVPTDELSWIDHGVARLHEDPNGALADFDRALQLNPRSWVGLKNKAHVLCEVLNRTEDAVGVLDELVARYPGDVAALRSRGVLRARLGRRAAAHQDAEAALTLAYDAPTFYQIAGIYALTSQQAPEDRHRAYHFLTLALTNSYGLTLMKNDPDLKPLRSEPEFQRLVAAREAAAASTR